MALVFFSSFHRTEPGRSILKRTLEELSFGLCLMKIHMKLFIFKEFSSRMVRIFH